MSNQKTQVGDIFYFFFHLKCNQVLRTIFRLFSIFVSWCNYLKFFNMISRFTIELFTQSVKFIIRWIFCVSIKNYSYFWLMLDRSDLKWGSIVAVFLIYVYMVLIFLVSSPPHIKVEYSLEVSTKSDQQRQIDSRH